MFSLFNNNEIQKKMSFIVFLILIAIISRNKTPAMHNKNVTDYSLRMSLIIH